MNSEVSHSSDLSEGDSLSPELQERLADILDSYLVSLEQGVPLDLERIKTENPELAGPLREYLEGLAILQNEGAELQIDRSTPSFRPDESTVPVAKQLGDFELIREVGRGGMGVVYEARQTSLDRLVALKVLPFAAMLDEKQIARFENEARAAAQLHHPNIVPIHGVGSDRGVHFYAMQLINGQSLQQIIRELRDDGAALQQEDGRDASSQSPGLSRTVLDMGQDIRCEETRSFSPGTDSDRTIKVNLDSGELQGGSGLSSRRVRSTPYIESIVRLIVQAADGLHAAHQYGVIHRDVKPSNLMLDEAGKLWITDFGLARFQTDNSVTRSGEILGTLHYMSPEQAGGRNALVDERSDVYSLGVTLYELLTLQRPFEGEAQHEVIQAIEFGQFPRPRACNPRITHDLENVLLKAMSVAREDRYDNAKELGEDLRRFLDGKPTQAKRPMLIQQLSKWTRRHQRSVLAACVAMTVAIAGLTISNILLSKQQEQTKAALDRSQANLMLAQDAVEEFVEDVDRLLEPRADSQRAREKLLKRSLEYYQAFVRQAGDSEQLQNDIAIARTKMASISAMQGDVDAALAGYDLAVGTFKAQLSCDESIRADYVRCLNNIGSMHVRLNNSTQAEAVYRQAISIGEENVGADDRLAISLVESYNNLGLFYAQAGELENAAEEYRRGLERLEGLWSQAITAEQLKAKSSLHNNMWDALRNTNSSAANHHIEQAIELRSQLAKKWPMPEHKSLLASSYSNLASSCTENNDFDLAAEAFGKAANLQRQLVRQEPLALGYRNELAVTLNNLGHLQVRLGDSQAAEATFQDALKILNSLVRDVPNDIHFRSHLGGAYNNLALVHKKSGQLETAEAEFQRGIQQLKDAYNRVPQNAKLRDSLSRNYFNYGQLLIEMGSGYRAAKMAMRRRGLWPNDGKQLHAVATELAIAYRKTDARRQKQVEHYAVETIELAVEAGWKPENLNTDVALGTFSNNAKLQAIVSTFNTEDRETVDDK